MRFWPIFQPMHIAIQKNTEGKIKFTFLYKITEFFCGAVASFSKCTTLLWLYSMSAHKKFAIKKLTNVLAHNYVIFKDIIEI